VTLAILTLCLNKPRSLPKIRRSAALVAAYHFLHYAVDSTATQ